jgi:hypothetical protein
VEVRREQRTRLVVLQEPRLAGCRKAAGGCSEGARILLRRQVDTETEHKHFMHRVKGGGVWLGCGKRLLDSQAVRAVILAASSGLGLVIFSLNISSQKKKKTMLRRISSQTSSVLKVWESLIYAV